MGALHEHQLAGLLGGGSVKRSVSDGSTIREELVATLVDAGHGKTEVQAIRVTLRALGIDPDLPAEWATVDRCLTWLRDGLIFPVDLFMTPNDSTFMLWLEGEDGRFQFSGPTLHAALVTACQTVQEAS